MRSWYRFRQRDALKDPSHAFSDRYTGNMSVNEFVQGFYKQELMLKQSDFIADHPGNLLVDFVGRYENLQADFNKVCETLELPQSTLPVVNTSRREGMEEEELDRSSLDIINDYFARDFEMFGYERH